MPKSILLNPISGQFDEISEVAVSVTPNGLSIDANQVISLALSSTSTVGALSAADWNTFNGKQPAGSYITALTGEVTATGPGSVAATITNNAVTNAKLEQMANNTFKGNVSGILANPSDLTAAQVLGAGILDDIGDVNAPTPAVNDQLSWNGSQWINSTVPTGQGSGVLLYFDDTASDIATYFQLLTSPSSAIETIDTVAVTSGTSPVAIENYATVSGGLGITSIPAGAWIFSLYGSVSAGATCTLLVRVYSRTSGGVETLLFTANTPTLTTTPTLFEVESVQPAFAVATTDRLVVKVLATNTSATSRNVSFYHSGNTHASHIHTTLIQKHNDLAGLQGGTSTERYHLSLAEHDAATRIATSLQSGLLSAADWTTFNAKQSALTLGNLTDVGTDGITVTGGTGAVVGTGTALSQHVADATHNGYLASADWSTFNGKQAALTPGSISEASSSVLTITNGSSSTVGPNVTIQVKQASGAQSGYLGSTDWTAFNNKQAALTIGNLTDVGTDGITITGGTGSVIGTGTSLSQHVADSTHNGYLSSTDWATFNGKQSTLTLGNFTEATSSVLTIVGGTGAVVGTGLSVQVKQASTSVSGFLSNTDWNTFNGKQAALTIGNLTGTANRLGVTGGTGAVIGSGTSLNIDTTLLPSPLAGDVNKVLTATGANAATWQATTGGSGVVATQFVGSTGSTSSVTPVQMPSLSTSVTTTAGQSVQIFLVADMNPNTGGDYSKMWIYIDGSAVTLGRVVGSAQSDTQICCLPWITTLSAGTHTIAGYYACSAGTVTLAEAPYIQILKF